MSELRPARAGFALVEMLIASTLGLTVLLMLVQTLAWISQRAEEQVQELDRSAKAKMVLDMIEADLQSLVAIRSSGAEWMCIDVLQDEKNTKLWVKSPVAKPNKESLRMDVDDSSDYRFGKAGMWIRFFTCCEDRSRQENSIVLKADVNAVAYQIIRRELSALRKSDARWSGYQLFRSVVRSDHVFKEGYQLSRYAGASYLGYPGEIPSPRLDSAVCEQILDLGFRVFEKMEDGELIEVFPSRDERLPPLPKASQLVVPRDALPKVLEVYVRVLTPRGAKRLRLYEQGKLQVPSWWFLAEQESRVYRKVVTLPDLGI